MIKFQVATPQLFRPEAVIQNLLQGPGTGRWPLVRQQAGVFESDQPGIPVGIRLVPK
jgi:hypothetical protein